MSAYIRLAHKEREVLIPHRSPQRRADGAVSRFGPMPPVTVRVTTLVFVPVKFDRDVKLVHSTELAVTVVNRQQPLARYSSTKDVKRGTLTQQPTIPRSSLLQ